MGSPQSGQLLETWPSTCRAAGMPKASHAQFPLVVRKLRVGRLRHPRGPARRRPRLQQLSRLRRAHRDRDPRGTAHPGRARLPCRGSGRALVGRHRLHL